MRAIVNVLNIADRTITIKNMLGDPEEHLDWRSVADW